MRRDFTIQVYCEILNSLQQQAFLFIPFREFLKSQEKRNICLRHDVDLLPDNSLAFAKIQNKFGIKGSYYFRAVQDSWNEEVIRDIYELGHEIGYHYESLTTTSGNIQQAISIFEKNLEKLRRIVPVSTICMHGSPRSRWDSKELWKYYDYRDYGIEAEPYFDVDFSKVLYLTDTGRKWNGSNVSVRDKLAQQSNQLYEDNNEDKYAIWKMKPQINSAMHMTMEAIRYQQKCNFRSTFDIIVATEKGNLPDNIMMTFHPQRWTDQPIPWIKELLFQNTKNIVKYFFIKMGKK